MFAIVRNGSVVTLIGANVPFTFEGLQYPANWIDHATPAEKQALGLKRVERGETPDPVYFTSVDDVPVYDADYDVVRIAVISTPRPMDELQTRLRGEVDRTAYDLLLPSDWMVTRSVEDPNRPLTPEWAWYRDAVRAEARRAKDKITVASTVHDLMLVMRGISWPPSP